MKWELRFDTRTHSTRIYSVTTGGDMVWITEIFYDESTEHLGSILIAALGEVLENTAKMLTGEETGVIK